MGTIRSIKNVGWKILNAMGVGGGVQLTLESGLLDDGWFQSYYKKESINRKGEVIPWYTYAFIKFIQERIQPHFEVFEFGCGNSTIWYGERVKQVRAVEHDTLWYDKMKAIMPSNVDLIFHPLASDEYINEVWRADKKYHIIIVDGRRRSECLLASASALKEDGVVILDNSEREEYQKAIEVVKVQGYKKLDFWGIAPVAANNTCTSVFYKEGNCLNV